VKPIPPTTAPRASVALRFKTEIERAESDGVSLEDMALHLTLGDVEQLKRDRAVPVPDISFTGGIMKYLGVKVLKGDVPLSVLRRPVADNV
jgi:hypothetical protein